MPRNGLLMRCISLLPQINNKCDWPTKVRTCSDGERGVDGVSALGGGSVVENPDIFPAVTTGATRSLAGVTGIDSAGPKEEGESTHGGGATEEKEDIKLCDHCRDFRHRHTGNQAISRKTRNNIAPLLIITNTTP